MQLVFCELISLFFFFFYCIFVESRISISMQNCESNSVIRIWLPKDSIPAYASLFYRKNAVLSVQIARWGPSIDFQVIIAWETFIPLGLCNGKMLVMFPLQQLPVFSGRCFCLLGREEGKKKRRRGRRNEGKKEGEKEGRREGRREGRKKESISWSSLQYEMSFLFCTSSFNVG